MAYVDPITGQLIEELWDSSSKKLIIRTTENVEPLLDEIALEKGLGNNGWSTTRTWRKMGSIPCLEIERVLREEGINMMDNSPEAQKRVRKYFRDNNKLSIAG
jgi:hypothetical protein